jgi:hypothetical protein
MMKNLFAQHLLWAYDLWNPYVILDNKLAWKMAFGMGELIRLISIGTKTYQHHLQKEAIPKVKGSKGSKSWKV